MSSNKQVIESIDRLGALPDSLIIHILTFASFHSDVNNVRVAARTSVLSKRWRYLWCELTTLRFRIGHGDNDETSKLVAMVHKTLLCRTAKSLEEFNLCFRGYNSAWASHVDIWIEFALKLKSKMLHLVLSNDSTRYLLPELLYSNSVLTELSLVYCTVAPSRPVDWKSLTKLEMVHVELHQNVIENILSGCPVMRSLELRSCWGFNSLKIDSPCLHKLSVLDEGENEEEDASLEISAPYLCILKIMIQLDGKKFWLKNIPAVVEVKVDFDAGFRYGKETPVHVINVVKKLFQEIQHIKKLHMGTHFFHFVSNMVAHGWQLQQQSRLQSLKIDHFFYFGDIKSGVLSILESCPNLETLKLLGETKEPPLHPRLSMSDDLNCDLLHLKMVGLKISVRIDHEISMESCSMLVLVQILLRRAVALEKMEIRFEILNRDVKIEDREEFDKVVEEVLSWPKSSQALLICSSYQL